MACRTFMAAFLCLSVNLFTFQAFSQEPVEQILSLPNKGSSVWIARDVFNSLAARECASTPNMPSLTPQLKNQEVFDVFPIYFDFSAEKKLWDLGYRSCSVIKNWPMEVKNAVKSISSNDSWLSDRDAEANIEFYSPKWLRLDPKLRVQMFFLGGELKERGVSLGEFRRICHSINLEDKSEFEGKQEFIQYYKDNGILDENGLPTGWECSNSSVALESDVVVKKAWGHLDDLYDKSFVSEAEAIKAWLGDWLENTDLALEREARLSDDDDLDKLDL